jgi:hypothetical protein
MLENKKSSQMLGFGTMFLKHTVSDVYPAAIRKRDGKPVVAWRLAREGVAPHLY